MGEGNVRRVRSFGLLEGFKSRDYTHVSRAHDTGSRIDYFLGCSQLFSRVTEARVGSIMISDHAVIWIDIQWGTRKCNILWRYWLEVSSDKKFGDFLEAKWKEYDLQNAEHKVTPTLFWETAKAILRGKIIRYGI